VLLPATARTAGVVRGRDNLTFAANRRLKDAFSTMSAVHKISPPGALMAVRVDLNISLDGFATTTDQTPENPFGEDWSRLVDAYVATKTFRERVLHDTSGEGTTGVDDEYAVSYFAEVGAEIMGAGMFGLHNFPDDLDWQGWWGDEPPFRIPVFVLTHGAPRPSIEMAGGTTFHFLSATPQEALDRALEAAAGKDVRVGGGATSSRQGSSTSSTSRSPRFSSDAASASGMSCAVWNPRMKSPLKRPRAAQST
jgi:hypothetical protein